ncbi:MAG TPA: GGDEF domain-containing protein [Solirubrobacteraceae bacterium]|nr:GGDEF domain-containing protein [Solirubrobacteraceae bacterium]
MSSAPYPPIDDPRDEGRLADLVSAGMWTTAGLVGGAMFALPGSTHEHLGYGLAVAAAAVAWGLISLVLYVTGATMSLRMRAVVTATTAPLVTAAIWASGGTDSFLGPLLLFTSLFIAYFFPPRLAWPLVALFAGVYATPLLYDPTAIDDAYPARALAFTVAIAGESLVMQLLKRRLLLAEARQRVMAERDPLTALYNRRSFDAALERALRMPEGAALVLFDFDDFKQINDEHGHPVGDAVLRAISDACEEVVREGDCLARIGGDEFAVIAPGARSNGVARIVASLEAAIDGAEFPDGIPAARASFAWAVAPADGVSGQDLLDRADQRLLYRKRLNKSGL